MKHLAFLAVILSSACLVAAHGVRADPLDRCTCVTTIVGDGDHKERRCDGFDPETHTPCACEKVEVAGQAACQPKRHAEAGPNPSRARAKTIPGN